MLIKHKGFSLIELMIALAIGMFALFAILSLMTNNLNINKTAMNGLRLNQEMRSAIQIMADDIRRAGYWNNSDSMIGVPDSESPYAYPDWPITISGGNCITFSYDRDVANDTPDISEQFGYILSNNSIKLGNPTVKTACTDPLETVNWQPITDNKVIKVTGLTFDLINPTNTTAGINQHQFTLPGTSDLLCVREVKITINAELTNDSQVKQRIEKTIRVRNDEIRRSPAASCA